MATSDSKDTRDLTRAMLRLSSTQEKLLKVCEAINTNLLAIYKQTQKSEDCSDSSCDYREPHKHSFACDPNCSTCKGFISAI